MRCIYSDSRDQGSEKFTIFSIPKPFVGHIGIIQYNAIASWTLLTPKPEIILFGDEQGTEKICKQFGLIHVPEIDRNEFGTPLLNSIFAEVHDRASTDIIAYLNADIILNNDFPLAIQSVSQELNDYLLIGRRWNIDLNQRLEFDSDWQSDLDERVKTKGCLADYDCKDYFVFPKHLFASIPAFALGRGYWDTWMVIEAFANDYPVVDGSLSITAIHQNHPYTHIRGGKNEAYMGQEAQSNKILGNVTQPGNIACATWQLKPQEYELLPTLSVVIVTQNESTTIEKALLSVLIQNYPNYEIIILNHGGCDRDLKSILQPYQNEISYYFLGEDTNPYLYSLQIARGEFVTFLDPTSIMLRGVLEKQVKSFEQESSTLDVLLSGCKKIEQKVVEYKPWSELPSLQELHPSKLDLFRKHLLDYPVMFRRHRLVFSKDSNLESNFLLTLSEMLTHLIFFQKCRANCLKLITHVDYPEKSFSNKAR